MVFNKYVLIVYGIFLLVLLIVNILYFLQIFKYRLPGDASMTVVTLHILLVVAVLVTISAYITSLP